MQKPALVEPHCVAAPDQLQSTPFYPHQVSADVSFGAKTSEMDRDARYSLLLGIHWEASTYQIL